LDYSNTDDRRMTAEISTVCSTVSCNFAAKPRNSAQRDANAKCVRYLASARLCKTVK
jgi:hypothetical protein